MSTYINKNGQQSGPFTEDQIKDSLKNGDYSPDDLCWKEGWESWKKLGSVYSEKKSSIQNVGGGHPQTVSDFEKRIFGFTRWFVGTIAAGVVLLIAILLIVIIFPIGSSKVTYSEVMSKEVTSSGINPVNSLISNYTNAGDETQEKVRIPKNVQDEFQGKNAEILQQWIKACPASQQQDFVDNLSRLIEKGKEEGLSSDKINDLENDYHKLKRQKIMSAEMMKYIALGVKLGAAVLIFMLILILCIVSLILVLLAIERNTRARI
jgi:hypothetical protein